MRLFKKKAPRETDFSNRELPATRWALLWDCWSGQWRILMASSWLLALFVLPLLADYFVFSALIGGLDASSSSYSSSVFSLLFYASLLAIPCVMALYVGLSGAFCLAKRLAYLEGTLATSDFFRGLRDGWKRALAVGAIEGTAGAAAFMGSFYLLLFYASAPIATGIGMGLLIFVFVLVTATSYYFLSQEAIYDNGFFPTLKNSFLFALMKMPVNVLFVIMSPGIAIALFLISQTTAYVAIALILFFAMDAAVAFQIYANGVYDQTINETYYPELVGKGLHKKED
ncbi:MAG: hypothetical protein LKK13_03645 [Bacilli bacterium]|jgi:hypothetical protein|nr:hypothetical protein [Bacilli bacterium]